MKRKFVLRHWRGTGSIIPDIMRSKYYDYPKHRNKRPYSLAECIFAVITEDEYKAKVLERYGQEALDIVIKRYKL